MARTGTIEMVNDDQFSGTIEQLKDFTEGSTKEIQVTSDTTSIYPDVMVDLETTGLAPDRNAIIQIAAVRFNLATRSVGPDFFNRCLWIPRYRSWDMKTLQWWNDGKSDILNRILAAGEEPKTVLEDLQFWLRGYNNKAPRMWAKPITFEFPMLSSYFEDYEMSMPLSYREAMDIASYVRGINGDDGFIKERDIPFEGIAHDAIWDCLHQIKWLFVNQDKREGKG